MKILFWLVVAVLVAVTIQEPALMAGVFEDLTGQDLSFEIVGVIKHRNLDF